MRRELENPAYLKLADYCLADFTLSIRGFATTHSSLCEDGCRDKEEGDEGGENNSGLKVDHSVYPKVRGEEVLKLYTREGSRLSVRSARSMCFYTLFASRLHGIL